MHRSVQNSLPAYLIEKCADRAHDLMEYDDDEVLWAPPVVGRCKEEALGSFLSGKELDSWRIDTCVDCFLGPVAT